MEYNTIVQAVNGSANLLNAYHTGTLGVSIGCAGFLLGYLAGAAYLLAELGIITPSTKVAGASAGALVSSALCAGVPPDTFLQGMKDMSNTCRRQANCQQSLSPAFMAFAAATMPPDAYSRCSNRAFLSVTSGPFPDKNATKNLLVSSFSSNADLAAAIGASSYIPFWSGRQATTTFRGGPAVDGYFSDAQPCPPGTTACINISAINPRWELHQVFRIVSRAMGVGPKRPARLSRLPPGVTADVAPVNSPAQALQIARAMQLDIVPGVYTPALLPKERWEEIMVMPGDDALNDYLWNLGRRDAGIWAAATGLDVAAAAARASRGGAQGGRG